MKPIFILTILILSTFFFASCTPEEDPTIGIDTSPNTFVGNLDGTEWRSANREAKLVGNYLSVYGLSNNGTLLSLRVKLYDYQPINKAYILSNTSEHYVAYDNTSGFDSLVYWSKNNPDINGQSGDITITKIDLVQRKVSGTYRSRVFNNHTPLQYYYFSQGAFTDVPLVDSLTIPFAGSNFVNYNGGNTGGGNNGGGNNGGGNNGGDVTQTQYINCSVNGSPFVSTVSSLQSSQSYFLFNANYGTANIMIRLPFTLGVGVHDIPSSGAAVIYTTMTTQYGNNQVGTLEITSKTSERITGKFNVTAQNSASESITLSNGTFSFSILQ